MGLGPASLLSDVLDDAEALAIFVRYVPGVVNSPMLGQFRAMPLERLLAFGAAARLADEEKDRLWAELAASSATETLRVEAPAILPDPDYEDASVERGSARVVRAEPVGVWGSAEVVIDGPSHGNPFTDVELHAVVSGAGTERVVWGFYDGDGRYVVRFLPDAEGEWTVTTASTARSLDGLTATVTVGPPEEDVHGLVRVADTFHFAYDDGTRHLPLGTTAYAWTHQSEALQERTLRTLAEAPFTKIRLCVFPKSYLFNTNDPEVYPFPRDGDGFDLTRFDPEYFRRLERRIDDLAALGIEADLILFHAYDRWGFADMGKAADDRYLDYVVRRLASRRNVWWSLANEYDLLWSKDTSDWERFADIVTARDPYGHLLSIHNCFGFYDHSRPWVTHASVQRVDVYRTAENTDAWREQWGKPVVIDECAYEGDIDQGWGNITGEEMTRRFWEGAVRGGYVGHGETYLNDQEELWWSKGGELVGSSPDRIAFLKRITQEAPGGVLDPLPSDWDAPWGGVADEYLIVYFGFNRPSYRDVTLAEGIRWHVDVVDTWNMTVERLDGEFEGSFRVPLPARQYMAIRFTAVA